MSSLHKHLSQGRVDPNQAAQQALLTPSHLLKHSNIADTSYSTAMLPMQPPKICPLEHI